MLPYTIMLSSQSKSCHVCHPQFTFIFIQFSLLNSHVNKRIIVSPNFIKLTQIPHHFLTIYNIKGHKHQQHHQHQASKHTPHTKHKKYKTFFIYPQKVEQQQQNKKKET